MPGSLGHYTESQEELAEKMHIIANRGKADRSIPNEMEIRGISAINNIEPQNATEGEEGYKMLVQRLVGYVSSNPILPSEDSQKWKATAQEVTVELVVEDSSCFLEGNILGKKVRFLLDTGASMSIITKSALQSIPGSHKLASTRTSCRTADGSEVKIHGVCILEMEIKGVKFPLTLHVTSDTLTNTGILGLDHLAGFGATLNLSSEPFKVTLSNRGLNVVRRLEAPFDDIDGRNNSETIGDE
jgi:hypothetical protein